MTVIITKKILFALAVIMPIATLTSSNLLTRQTIPYSQIVKADAIVNTNNRPLTVEIKSNKTIHIIPIICTFYSNSLHDCGKTDAISASGKNLNTLSRGGSVKYVAAPKAIVFGTQLNVAGIGDVLVEDRGGAIKWIWENGIKYMKLDVFVPGATREQLLKMGVLKTRGYIVKYGQDN